MDVFYLRISCNSKTYIQAFLTVLYDIHVLEYRNLAGSQYVSFSGYWFIAYFQNDSEDEVREVEPISVCLCVFCFAACLVSLDVECPLFKTKNLDSFHRSLLKLDCEV